MSDNDFLYLRYGDVNYPLGEVQNGQLFSVADPARDSLITFFKSAINQEFGHSMTSVSATSPWGIARVGTSLASAMPVQDTAYLAPTPDLMREANWGMPLLCFYRISSAHDEFTLSIEQITTLWGLDYILPPLAPEDRRKLGGILNGIRTLIPLIVRESSHPAYNNGQVQFGVGYGGFRKVRVGNTTEGPVAFSDREGGNYYYSIHMEIETIELDNPLYEAPEFGNPNSGAITISDKYTPLDGVDVNVGVGGSDGLLQDAIQARTDTNPDPNYGKIET